MAGSLVELELQNSGEEIAGIRCIPGNMELSTGIEGIRGTINRRFYALILQSQCRPGMIVIRRCDRTIGTAPAPLGAGSEERLEGKEYVSTCRTGWEPRLYKKTTKT